MVRIRLRRVGSKNQPSYRIIAADKESPRDGRFLENLGHYNPRTEPSTVVVDEARLFHWLQHGAQPSDAVRKILNPLKTWDRWERFKAGEDIDTLLEEAEASSIDVDPRTRRDDLFGKRSEKKAAAKKEAATAKEVVEPEPASVEEVKEEPAEVTIEQEMASEDPAEVTIEEVVVSEEAETSSEPDEEEQAPEDAAEEVSDEPTEEDDAGEEESAPAEVDEADKSEEDQEDSED